MDLSVLAQNLPKVAAIAGAFGGGSHASTAGVLAGLGDYQHAQNERAYQGVKSFADELEKITPEQWGEQAHEQAMQERLNLLNPKTIAKIYSNPGAADKLMQQAWQNVHAASGRPVDTATQQQEKNAAAGSIPAFQQQQQQAPAMSVLGNSTTAAPLPGGVGGGLAALGNAVGIGSGMAGAAGEQNAQATMNAPPQGMRYGMLSPVEQSMRRAAALRPLMQAYGGMGAGSGTPGGVGGGGLMPMVGFDAKGNPTMHMRVDTSRPLMLDLGDGGPLVPGFYDAAQQAYIRSDTHQAVNPKNYFSADRPIAMTEAGGPTGSQKQIVSRNQSIGKTFAQPVPLTDETITNNGTVSKFGRNRITGQNTTPFATGTTPNRDIAESNLGLRRQANVRAEQATARQNAAFDYTYGGWTTDVTGNITGVKGTRFTPAGTPIDANGQPISKIGFSQTKAPAAVQTRARVAGDARDQADRMMTYLDANPALVDKFGPLEGRTMQWLVDKGIISGADIKGLQMQMASMESMNPAVHQMRNFAVAKDIADRLGDMGQPYANFHAGVQTLRDFYDQVAKSGVRPVVPTAKAPKAAVRPPTTAAPAGTIPPPSANMQTLQAIQKLLAGGQ